MQFEGGERLARSGVTRKKQKCAAALVQEGRGTFLLLDIKGCLRLARPLASQHRSTECSSAVVT